MLHLRLDTECGEKAEELPIHCCSYNGVAVWQIIAAIGIILYPIGIPAFIIYSLWKHHNYLYHNAEELEGELEILHTQRDCYGLVIDNCDGKLPPGVIDIYYGVDAEVILKEAELEAVCVCALVLSCLGL